MKWTTEKPTQEGWYWFRSQRHIEQVCRVNFYAREKIWKAYFTDGAPGTIIGELTEGEWCGPIKPPK